MLETEFLCNSDPSFMLFVVLDLASVGDPVSSRTLRNEYLIQTHCRITDSASQFLQGLWHGRDIYIVLDVARRM
jgi:hypothetical protein